MLAPEDFDVMAQALEHIEKYGHPCDHCGHHEGCSCHQVWTIPWHGYTPCRVSQASERRIRAVLRVRSEVGGH